MNARILLLAILMCLVGLTSDVSRKSSSRKRTACRKNGNPRVVLVMDANTLLQVGRYRVLHGENESGTANGKGVRTKIPGYGYLSEMIKEEKRLLASGETITIIARFSMNRAPDEEASEENDEEP